MARITTQELLQSIADGNFNLIRLKGLQGGTFYMLLDFNPGAARLNLINSIIAGSTGGGDCFNISTVGGTNSHNLVQDGSCSPAASGDPKLGPLQNNGGPTFTHALLADSQAID